MLKSWRYTIVWHCYWKGMYEDAMNLCRNCSECVTVSGSGKLVRLPLYPIPVQRPFQILGVDVMDLPVTEKGNKHVVVFQDYFTKYPSCISCSRPEGETFGRSTDQGFLSLGCRKPCCHTEAQTCYPFCPRDCQTQY